MVTARASIRQGFRLARRAKSAVFILFTANLLLAAVAGLPIYQGMINFTSHSLMGRKLLTGFSYNWFTDFIFNSRGEIGQYAQFIMVMGLIAMPVNAILAGGVLTRFQRPKERVHLGTFFRDCGRYAWRMLWLMILALFAYWAVFRFVLAGLGGKVDRLTLYWMNDRSAYVPHLGVGLLVLMALVFVNLVVDFAKVRIVLADSGVLESFLAALGFSIFRIKRAVVVYAGPALCGIGLLGIYRLVTPWHLIRAALGDTTKVSYETSVVLAALFVGQQLVMFGRYWFRVATWGSEWSFYAGVRAPAKPPEESGNQAAA
jgi:hypothetical protein